MELWSQEEREAIMPHPKLIVSVGFEPGRVGVQPLIDAYSNIVPIVRRPSNRVLAITTRDQRLATWNYRRAQ